MLLAQGPGGPRVKIVSILKEAEAGVRLAEIVRPGVVCAALDSSRTLVFLG